MYAYFIDIPQGSVETYLLFGGIYNNYIIANCQIIANWLQRRNKPKN